MNAIDILGPESDLKTWRTLPQAMRDLAQAVLIENVKTVRAVVEYRYRAEGKSRSVHLFSEEHLHTDPPVAFILGENVIAGVLVHIGEYHRLADEGGIEQWVVFVDVPEEEK